MKIYDSLKPTITPSDKGLYVVSKDFQYICPKYRIPIMVRSPFIFDGASIPRVLWTATGSPFLPRYIGPGLVHDYLYRFASDWDRRLVTRRAADKVFLYALKINGVNRASRMAMYLGVRSLGWYSWNKHRNREKR